MDAAAVGLWGLFTSAFLSATLLFIALGKIAQHTVKGAHRGPVGLIRLLPV